MLTRSIIHLDLDTFFVSCERKLDAKLHGKPILVGGTSSRGVVAACSYEARAFGIHSAMPMKLARQLCPQAIVIRGNSAIYSKYSDEVTDIIAERSPLYEKSSIDEFYIDMTGMDKFFGSFKWAQELRMKIMKETGLPISFGLSTSKTVAKVGTNEAKPNNFIQVESGMEKPFLAPLPVKKIPMVGDETSRMLLNMGVKWVRTVQDMPIEMMERVMGKHGIDLWKKAQGIDNSPVIPYYERKSISLERTFERDTTDIKKLHNMITAMAENLSYQLRQGNKLTSCIAVKIRYSDFQTHIKQLRIPYTSCDHLIIKRVHELFDKLYDRRVLLRLIGVRLSHLVEGAHQINMFEDTQEVLHLYYAMDKIRNRYGQDAVMRAVSMDSPNIGHIGNPFDGRPPVIPAHRRA